MDYIWSRPCVLPSTCTITDGYSVDDPLVCHPSHARPPPLPPPPAHSATREPHDYHNYLVKHIPAQPRQTYMGETKTPKNPSESSCCELNCRCSPSRGGLTIMIISQHIDHEQGRQDNGPDWWRDLLLPGRCRVSTDLCVESGLGSSHPGPPVQLHTNLPCDALRLAWFGRCALRVTVVGGVSWGVSAYLRKTRSPFFRAPSISISISLFSSSSFPCPYFDYLY